MVQWMKILVEILLSPFFLCMYFGGVRRSLEKEEKTSLYLELIGKLKNVFGFLKITSLYFHIYFLCFI
jgi:hypothetical protein